MLKELFDRIQETAQPKIVEANGRMYAVRNDLCLPVEIEPVRHGPDTLLLNSLDSLVKMVQSEGIQAEDGKPLYITVPTHLRAVCFAQFDRVDDSRRTFYYEAEATDVPGWNSKVTMPFAEAQIAMRTMFQETADLPYMMKLLSDISTGAKITYNDNGVATTVVTRKGVDLQGNDAIRPIVTLRPYRTFQEVAQPDSTFLIRIEERGISFIEADGGMWKLRTRETIVKYLEERLAKEIELGQTIVAL